MRHCDYRDWARCHSCVPNTNACLRPATAGRTQAKPDGDANGDAAGGAREEDRSGDWKCQSYHCQGYVNFRKVASPPSPSAGSNRALHPPLSES